jgi:predicted lipoprotein with Yx(FWY)xxD motif
MKILQMTRLLFALGMFMSVAISCSDDDDQDPDPVTPTNDIQLKDNQTLGKILTDKDGKTLYFFSKDAAGTSVCSGNCEVTWPVFSATDLTKLDAGLTAGDFATITRADGKPQTTYKGWPLYYFKDDAAAGDVKGENVGGVWFVAKTDYTVMLANAQLVGLDGKSYKADYTEGTADTQFFVDDMGRTLYAFARDSSGINNWTTNDPVKDATWPIYEVSELKGLPSNLDKTMFATIDVFGKKQLTYKGWPLYYFGPDEMKRGMTKGVSVPRPGVWPIVNKDSPNAPK